MEGEQKVKLFREKSLEAVESPESLNDYLRVTSAGVWLIMSAVITVLVGVILWSIFGQIDSKVKLAVYSSEGSAVCYVPYGNLEKVMKSGSVTVEGKSYSLSPNKEDVKAEIVSETMNPYIRITGGLGIGDSVAAVLLEGDVPPDGVYAGTAVVESLKPISLLLQ